MAGFTKLWSSLVTSSIWCADDATLRVWIAMLATANAHGVVEGSVPGFASLCRVSVEQMRAALAHLEAIDPDSRTREHEGRRIEAVAGGWRVLNYRAYRERGQDQAGSRAADMRRYRARGQGNALPALVTRDTEAEAEAEAEAKTAMSVSTPTPLPETDSAEPLARSAPASAAAKDRSRAFEPTDTSATVLTYPTIGRGGTSWVLSEALVAEWAELYPGLGVVGECRQALAWLRANPGRRKTARGMPSFLVAWLNRAVDHPRGAHEPGRPAHPRVSSIEPGPSDENLAKMRAIGTRVRVGEDT